MQYLLGFAGVLYWFLELTDGSMLWLVAFLALGSAALVVFCACGLLVCVAELFRPD